MKPWFKDQLIAGILALILIVVLVVCIYFREKNQAKDVTARYHSRSRVERNT
jgi:uncharacterized membrane protein